MIWILSQLAHLAAIIAIQVSGITYQPFIDGMQDRGQPVIIWEHGQFSVLGEEWRCRAHGDSEMCYAGLGMDRHGHLVWRTGP